MEICIDLKLNREKKIINFNSKSSENIYTYVHAQCIYWDSKLLVPVVCFPELIWFGLKAVWSEKHAFYTWFLPKPEKNLMLKNREGLTVLIYILWVHSTCIGTCRCVQRSLLSSPAPSISSKKSQLSSSTQCAIFNLSQISSASQWTISELSKNHQWIPWF